MVFGPAAVHTQQHFRPVLSLGAAAAGMHLKESIIAVDFTGKQSFQFAPFSLFPELCQLFQTVGHNGFIAFGLGQFGQITQIIQSRLHFLKVVQGGFEICFLAHQLLRFFGIVPQTGIGTESRQFIQTDKGIVIVKETSSAAQGTA